MNRPLLTARTVFKAPRGCVDDLFGTLVRVRRKKREPGTKDDTDCAVCRGRRGPRNHGVGEGGVAGHAGASARASWPRGHNEVGDSPAEAQVAKRTAVDGHAGFERSKDAWLTTNHVGHGHKGGEAGEEFAAERMVCVLEE